RQVSHFSMDMEAEEARSEPGSEKPVWFGSDLCYVTGAAFAYRTGKECVGLCKRKVMPIFYEICRFLCDSFDGFLH
ncbi:hypothetical protein OFB58_27245, partial [Escherichia coli]|nr:hypothetical protein [Escherichia coli]